MKDWLTGKNLAYRKSNRKVTERRIDARVGGSCEDGDSSCVGVGNGMNTRGNDDGAETNTNEEDESDSRELKLRQQQAALNRRGLVQNNVSDVSAEGKKAEATQPITAAKAWLVPGDRTLDGDTYSANTLGLFEAEPRKAGEATMKDGTGEMTWSIANCGAAALADGDEWKMMDYKMEEDGELVYIIEFRHAKYALDVLQAYHRDLQFLVFYTVVM